MIDWARVVGFEWDAANERKSMDKHHVSQQEAEQAFFNQPLLIVTDERHSGNEARFHALGRTDQGRPLHVTFTLRRDETLLRVISARSMSFKERKVYEQGA